MKTNGIIALTAALLLAAGCQETGLPVSAPQVVIEGWIENGLPPVVMVTTTVPVGETVSDISDLQEHVVNWAKVTVSDGDREIVLTGRKNEDYFPPYIYTTSKIRGEVGRTYSVKVEYSGRTVTATTSIPEPVNLEYIRVAKSKDKEGACQLIGGLRDDPETRNYYKVFTRREGKDSIHVSSFMGLTDDSILSDEISEIPINNGIGRTGDVFSAYFSEEDIVSVRFCTLDRPAWEYWNDFEEIQSLSRNPFFPITTSIRSNVKGGLGYWAGYGSTYRRVSIPDSLALGR